MPTTPHKLLQSPAQDFTRHLRDAVVMADVHFKIVHWNAAAEKLYGWTAAEAIGQIGIELLQTEFPEATKAERLRQIQTVGFYRGDGIQSRKDGSRIHVEMDSLVLKNDAGEITGYLSFNRDITDRILTQQALASQKSFLEVLTHSIPHIVCYWNTELRCEYANQAAGQWFGESPENILGRFAPDLIGETVYQMNKPLIEKALSGEPQSFERKLVSPGGREQYSLIQYLPRFVDGRVVGFLTLITDVSKQKAAETQLQTALGIQKALTDHSAFAMIQCNHEGIIQFINPAAERMLGYTFDELVGKQSPAIFHVVDEIVTRAAELTAELGQPVPVGFETFIIKSRLGLPNEHEWTYVPKNGKPFPVLLAVNAVRNSEGEITSYLGTAADVTKRKQLETQLRDAISIAEKANLAKGEFLATMSHEIRTPMNGVIGMIHALAESSLTEDQRDLLLTMQQSGELLLSVINDILDYSKIEGGHMEVNRDPIALSKLVGEMVALLKVTVERKGLRLRFDCATPQEQWVLGDRERIKQVLLNLITNAIKFTDKGSITVRLTETGDKIRVLVMDTGIGISAEKQSRVFERFSQMDASSTRRHGGTGLGLAISKRLVELMQGRIGFSSQENDGSTFWFELPTCPTDAIPQIAPTEKQAWAGAQAASPSQQSPVAAEPNPASWSPVPVRAIRVLLAEDNAVNQKVALRMLQKLQCEVEVAQDGVEALQLATQGRYDLVLMDCQMPNMDGFEATKKIREFEMNHPQVDGLGKITYPRVLIVALTAGAMTDEKAKCFSSGMDAFMAKPFKPEDMQKLIFEVQTKAKEGAKTASNPR